MHQVRKEFTFVSDALPGDTFTVVDFTGREGLSSLYEFEIMLTSEDADIDLKAVLQNPARLTILRRDEVYPVHGILARFEQLHEANRRVFYRAVLVPKLWRAGLYHENRVFLNKKVPEIIQDVLKRTGLTGQDYQLKLTRSYASWEYICQYQETNLNFISRWLEREGIYYFFEQTKQGAKLIITDSSSAHSDIQGDSTLSYSPTSGLIPAEEEVVKTLVCRQQALPKKVVLRDYNYLNPPLDVKGEEDIDPQGQGEIYIYGEDFKEPSQGKELAKIRAEEHLCRETVLHGEATAPTLSPGFIFELAAHFRDSYNQRYLITEVTHRGSQTGLLLAGLEGRNTAGERELGYANEFTCIPAGVQFRPERKTPKPVVRGSQTAVVVGPAGEKVHTDDQGRVKVQFHWDREGNKDENSSYWVRVGQLWAGAGWGGMHIPHIGQEVIVDFIEGDPDRPVIIGRVYNQENIPPLNKPPLALPANKLKSIIRDDCGNEIVFDSTPGASNIAIFNTGGQAILKAGEVNTYWTSNTDAGELFTGAKVAVVGGVKSETFVGSSSSLMAGVSADFKLAASLEAVAGLSTKIRYGPEYQIAQNDKVQMAEKDWMQVAQSDAIIDSQGEKGGKLLLVAGPARESVVDMGGDALCLSVGHSAVPHKVGNVMRDLTEDMIKAMVATAAAFHMGSAILAIGNYVGMAADETWTEAKADAMGLGSSVVAHTMSVATSIVANSLVYAMFKTQLKPEKVKEVINKRFQRSKIEMKKDGAINIFSFGKGPVTIMVQTGTIKLAAASSIELKADEVRAADGIFRSKNLVDLG
jgi:type VI secretion system secreted protein VgrG